MPHTEDSTDINTSVMQVVWKNAGSKEMSRKKTLLVAEKTLCIQSDNVKPLNMLTYILCSLHALISIPFTKHTSGFEVRTWRSRCQATSCDPVQTISAVNWCYLPNQFLLLLAATNSQHRTKIPEKFKRVQEPWTNEMLLNCSNRLN